MQQRRRQTPVLSERTRSLLGDGFDLRDLGLHKLKRSDRAGEFVPARPRGFPALRSRNATNLPTQPSRLIGREAELAALPSLIRAERLVTLSGPGGSIAVWLGDFERAATGEHRADLSHQAR